MGGMRYTYLDLPEALHDRGALDHTDVVLDHLGQIGSLIRNDVPARPQRAEFRDRCGSCAAQIGGREIEG